MCLPECPNAAITEEGGIYSINPERCTECRGYYSEPTCVKVCPVRCVKKDPSIAETEDTLKKKLKKLLEEN